MEPASYLEIAHQTTTSRGRHGERATEYEADGGQRVSRGKSRQEGPRRRRDDADRKTKSCVEERGRGGKGEGKEVKKGRERRARNDKGSRDWDEEKGEAE